MNKSIKENKMSRRVVRNKDNHDLLPWGGDGFVIGYVDEVNGPGAEEIQDFVPTRHELLQLVKFWVEELLTYEFHEAFLYAQYCSSGSRRRDYAWRRIAQIAEVLGKEQVEGAVDEAYAEFGKEISQKYKRGQRDWEIFMHGDNEERKALQEEIQREMEEYFRSR